ncbi:MAG TPA: thiamine pyrophosphate-dependent enzyme [Terriglobales bacterium]|nr:thiamine pyrophosphate-dependent enzyme [Terriglobales bacterium]
MEKIYERSPVLSPDAVSGFCPGCFHSTIHKIFAEVFDEMGLGKSPICVYGIGCCGNGTFYHDLNSMETAHGRAAAVATALKRTNPDRVVFSYQGDGDLAAIGLSETIYAANRGENITVIFVNNGTYGMTGGQMAPTTLVGQKATTAPFGRQAEDVGYPMHMCEVLNQLGAPHYLERVSFDSAPNIIKAKAAIKKAFQNQVDGKGFSFVECMSTCPTNWGLSPLESVDYMRNNTLKEFPVGCFRDKDKE